MKASKHLSRRGFLALSAGLAAVPILAACGESKPQVVEKVVTQTVEVEKVVTKEVPVEKVVTKTVEKVVTVVQQAPQRAPVTVSMWVESLSDVDPVFREHEKLYSKVRPHVTVKLVIMPWADIPVKTLTSLAGGDYPDVAYNHPELNPNWVAKGVIDPLDPIIASDRTFEFSDYLPGPLRQFQLKKQLWALPVYTGPLLFLYNRKLLEPLGMGDPWELYKQGKWTIETYDAMGAAAIKKFGGTGANKIYADREVPTNLKIWYLWLEGFGGKVWNSDPSTGGADTTEILYDDEKSLKGWDWLVKHVRDESFVSGSTASSFGGSEGMFISGKLAFYLASRFLTTKVPAELSAGTVPMYKMPNGDDTTRNASNALSVHKRSANKEEAWELIKYWTTTVMRDLIGIRYTGPTLKSHMDSSVWKNSIMPWDKVEVHNAGFEQDRRSFYHPPGFQEINAIVVKAYGEAVLGKSSKDAFEPTGAKINAILKDNLPK
ncbi:MAG: extracellular solute-binding protein [Armatimonadetes bacterium]|nr:extracellular solute-binding protein [Armatimonadota bacterium]